MQVSTRLHQRLHSWRIGSACPCIGLALCGAFKETSPFLSAPAAFPCLPLRRAPQHAGCQISMEKIILQYDKQLRFLHMK